MTNRLNPMLIVTIYTSAIRPKTLFGCEALTNCSSTNLQRLLRADRFCVKYSQRFYVSVNSNFAYIMLNVTPINLGINYRKLLMLGQLCRLPSDQLAKKVFVNRLIRFVNLARQFRGFIPDIYRILQNTACWIILVAFDNNVFCIKNWVEESTSLMHQCKLVGRNHTRTELHS